MKNRFLPFGLLVLSLGFSSFLLTETLTAAPQDNSLPDQKAEQHMQKIRSNEVTGIVNPYDVLKAREQLSLLNQKSHVAIGLDWLQAGPINFAGRSRVVMYDNQDPDAMTIYTGGVTGGVYKSLNQGLSWIELNKQSNEVLHVSSMTQTTAGTIYVGTGEVYCNGASFMGSGLYSSDDGMNFVLVPGTQPTFNEFNSDWAFIIQLAYDPNTGRLFAATNSGMKYSDDGNTWNSFMTGLAIAVTVGQNGTVLFVVDNHVYIAEGGNLNNITDLSTGEAGKLPVDNAGWTSLAIAPSNPSIMYASIATLDNAFLLGIYRSEDNGATWSLIFPPNQTYEPFGGTGCYSNTIEVFPNNPDMVLLGGNFCWLGEKYQPTGYFDWQEVGTYGFGSMLGGNGNYAGISHHDYAFRPNHPDEFAVATSNGISVGTYTPSEVMFSTNIRNLTTTQFFSVDIGPFGDELIGGGNRVGTELFNAIQLNNPKDGFWVPSSPYWTGTYCEWSQLEPSAILFSGTGFYPNFEPYVRSEDLGLSAALTFMGDITSNLSDFLPSTLWETINFPYSQDTLWIYARTGPIEADSTIWVNSMNAYGFRFTYTVPVTIPVGDSLSVLDPFHSRFFVYGSSGTNPGIFMTQDAIKFYKSPKFIQVAHLGTNIPTSLALSRDLNYLWCGTDEGKIYRLSNLTLALDSTLAYYQSPYCIVASNLLEYPEFEGRYITNVVIDPSDPNNVLVTLGNYGNDHYVYLTTNALDSLPEFHSVQGNLPHMPVYDGLFEMENYGIVVLGTDMGVFTTNDIFSLNPVWSEDLTGIGEVPVTDLVQQLPVHPFQSNIGYIAAATFGKGLYYDTTYYTPVGIDPGPIASGMKSAVSVSPNPTNGSVKISYYLDNSELVAASIYDLSGRLMKSYTLGYQSEGIHSSTLDLSGIPAGTYIIQVNQAYGKIVKTN